MWNGWLAGAFVWLVPFAISCLVIHPDAETGEMVRELGEDAFRTLMLASGSLAGAYATIKCGPQTRAEGVKLAVRFLVMNWVLDLMVLVPLMVPQVTGRNEVSYEAWVATVPHWFKKVGAGYIAFVVVCIVAGESAQRARNKSKDE